MAKGNKSASGRGLNLKAKLDIAEAKRNAMDLMKTLKDLNIQTAASTAAGTQPLSNYKQAQLAMQQSLRDARLETERFKQETERLRGELENGKVTSQTYKAEVDRLKIAEQDLKNQFQQGKITLQQYDAQLLKNRADQIASNTALNQSRIDTQNAKTALAQYTLEQKKLATAIKEARAAQRAAAGSYDEATARLKQLERQIKSVSGGFAATGPIQQARIREYNQLNDRLKAFDASMGNHQRNVGNYKSALAGVGGELASMASGYLSASFALQTLLTNTLQFQRIKTPLTFILGSEGAADNKLAELRKFADDLGLEFFTLAKTYKSFSAAARASNFDLNNSEKIFRSVTKASAVLGLSSEQLEGALLALQQMISKGNVQAEELRGQLSERLPGAFSLAAKAMGVTEKELNKLLQTGSVTANEMLPRLADELDKAYGDKAADGISGLNAELGGLKTAIQSLTGEGSFLSKNVFEPIVRGAKLAINELNQLTRGSLMENLRRLVTFDPATLKNQEKAYDLRDGLNNNISVLQSARKKDYSDSTIGDLKTEISQLDAAYKKATADYDKFRRGVSSGALKESGNGTVKYYAEIAKELESQRDRAAKSFRDLANTQVSGAKEIADNALTAVSDIRKRITALQKLPGSAIDGSDIAKRIKALQDRLKSNTGTGAKDAAQAETALKTQRNLQRDIDALAKKGSDKQKTQDEQELTEVEAKYKKLIAKAEDYNKAQAKIDAERIKRGLGARGLRVNSGGLLDAQSKEEDAVRDKIASENLKKSLDKQQDMYAAFEEAKIKIGKEKAEQRYEDQIDTDRTYLQKLEEQRDALLNPQKSKGGEEMDMVANQLQLKVLNEAIEKEKLVQQKKYDDLLASLVTFEKEVTKTKEDYATARATLEANGDEAGLAQLTKNYNKRLAELGDSHLQEMDAFKKLYAGIDNLSDENARKMLGNAEDALKSLKTKGVVISKELEAELAKLFGNTRIAIAERLPEKIIALANQIDNVARSVSDVNEEFGNVLSTLGNVVGQVGNIKKGINDLKDFKDKKDGFGSLTAGLGIFGAGISVISSVVKMFDRSAQREEQAAYARDLQNKQTEALNKSLERQIALLNEAYGTDRINKYSEAIKAAQDNEAKYQSQLSSRFLLTGNKAIDEVIAKFNNGEKISGAGALGFSTLYKNGALQSLPKDIESLQKLLDEGKLDASTATIVQNLIEANKNAKDLANNLRAENVGSSLDEITDSFITTLTDGTQNFGKSFEEVIRKSIINGFRQKLIEEQLQPFYNQFAELSKGGLTKDEIDALQKSYTRAAEDAKKNIKDLEAATGIDLTNPAEKASGIQGVITSAGLTEDSGNKLMGIFRGQYDQTKKIALSMGDIYKISTNHLAVAQEIAANTLRTANNTEGMGAKLDVIVRNTTPSGAAGKSLEQQMRDAGFKG